jgi:hypothetical protein
MRLQCLRDKVERQRISPPAVRPLVCCSLFQELRKRIKRRYQNGFGCVSGRNRFTKYARNRIRNVGAIIDRAPRSHVIFLTGTLPGSSDQACIRLAAWTGWGVQTVRQWINDYSPGALYFGVWEYQKRGALHLHLVVQCQTKGDASELKRRWRSRWVKVLDGISRKSGADLYERKDGSSWRDTKSVVRTDAQTVQFSVARYLAKYLSKGSSKRRRRCEYPPSAWSFCSRKLLAISAAAERQTVVRDIAAGQALSLFERVSGELAASAKLCCGYTSKYDAMVKGFIGLYSPIQASLLFDLVKDNFCAIGSTVDHLKTSRDPGIARVLDFFDGRQVTQAA